MVKMYCSAMIPFYESASLAVSRSAAAAKPQAIALRPRDGDDLRLRHAGARVDADRESAGVGHAGLPDDHRVAVLIDRGDRLPHGTLDRLDALGKLQCQRLAVGAVLHLG